MTTFKPSPRQNSILTMIDQFGFVSTEAMVAQFDVTPQTIRRDLNELSSNGLLSRFHGGAGKVKSAENPPYSDRLQTGVEAKQKIAAVVASIIPDDVSVFLGTGTTIEAVAEALINHKNLHIVTNNLNVAQILRKNTGHQITISCGQVRNHDGGIVGASSEEFIAEFRTDFGLIGISGVDEDGSLLEYEQQEIRTARTILENSRKIVMVADHYKFRRRAMNRIGHLRDVDIVVSDSDLDPHFREICKAEDIEVLAAD